MIKLTINNREVEANEGETILQVCRNLNIEIPTLCYDERLEPHSACRLCIVEVEGMRTLPTSCSTIATDGMKIHTHSPKVIEARREILDMMLSNHPDDCLTCPKSGECKLQEYCYKYDIKKTTFNGEKKNYPIDDSNPFFYVDLNKCIECGKCVRICYELQNTKALTFSERGFKTHVTVPFEMGINKTNCVSCGNCVSACPVGALMPKSKEKFRLWEVKKVKTTCSFCGVGCQMELLVKDDKVVGVNPVQGHSNDGLLCVKGKFGYKFINHKDRLKKPLIRKNNKLVEAEWEEAYELIANKIKDTIKNYGRDSIAGLSSARCTNEENYLFQKLFRGVIKTNNIDHCARL